MVADEKIIEQTREWIRKVVVGANFCPFAANELKQDRIRYTLARSGDPKALLLLLSSEIDHLDENPATETSLIILPGLCPDFNDYLDLIELAEKFLKKQKKQLVYQIASFHPQYLFQGSKEDDPANYTNRSLYPMIHLLREASITRVLANFPDPENIPRKNIAFANRKGLAQMKLLRESCF